MKSMIFVLIFSIFSILNASIVVGSVTKVVGSVKVKSEGSFKKSKVKQGLEIKEGDLITTSKSGQSVVELIDGSSIVLDSSSSVHFTNNASLDQRGGKVYYKITSRNAANALKVKTPFAIIGIKGTTFVVNTTDEQKNVILKEGLVGVESIKQEFELYRKKVQDEFASFVAQQQAEYEKFRTEQDKYAVAVPAKEFDLEAGNRISFSGENKVHEDTWSKKDDEEFAHFEALLK